LPVLRRGSHVFEVWLVSFLECDLGCFDRDEDRVAPCANPCAPGNVLTMCPE
jgi:hypothetical protein